MFTTLFTASMNDRNLHDAISMGCLFAFLGRSFSILTTVQPSFNTLRCEPTKSTDSFFIAAKPACCREIILTIRDFTGKSTKIGQW
jgi:hypothetical protein